MRQMIVACAALSAMGCVNASSRIASELGAAGLDPARAACVGERLEGELTLAQLRQLADAARAYARDDATPGRLTPADLARAASIRDPAVPIAVARAAAACA